jgi:hypothetical protein
MIADRTIQYAQRVADRIFGYRVRHPVQVLVVGRSGFTRLTTIGYACDLEHVEKLKQCLI